MITAAGKGPWSIGDLERAGQLAGSARERDIHGAGRRT